MVHLPDHCLCGVFLFSFFVPGDCSTLLEHTYMLIYLSVILATWFTFSNLGFLNMISIHGI